ncbi:hypothetical protein EVAR_39992_1 [Eumeta japonica]|uniref:Uncharacterized protein n=1 Tax=Eumeta variegata TaxID=151549 RepID=A0A4C1YEX1_EUMVA|nr:hypothetical protein EVAR_39992_1 [Eumeta japonica]
MLSQLVSTCSKETSSPRAVRGEAASAEPASNPVSPTATKRPTRVSSTWYTLERSGGRIRIKIQIETRMIIKSEARTEIKSRNRIERIRSMRKQAELRAKASVETNSVNSGRI